MRVPVRVIAAACGLVAVAPAPAAHAAEARALLLAERFTPAAAPADDPLARNLVALRGESETIQVAFRLDADAAVRPVVAVAGTAPAFLREAEIARVGFVQVRTPSTGLGTRPGAYADPLPRLPASGAMRVQGGRWNGVAITFRVPVDAAPGSSSGVVRILDARSGAELASVPFRLRVSSAEAIAPDAPDAFRVLFGFSPEIYRTYRGAPVDAASVDARFTNLMRFLERRGVGIADAPLAMPSADGSYTQGSPLRSWSGATRAFAERWNAELRLPARIFPLRGQRVPVPTGAADAGPAARYIGTLARYWNERGWSSAGNAYTWLYDEPNPARVKGTVATLSTLVHRAAPGVRTIVTTTPKMRTADRKLCKWFGNHACSIRRGERADNRQLWDGGDDDVDVLALPIQRYYGRWTSKLEAHYGIRNERRTWRVIQAVKRGGVEIWAYSYYRPFTKIPQLAIDASATDRRVLMLWSAFEGNTGFLHWGLARWVGLDGTPRDPYADPLSIRLPNGDVSNGEATLLYPPVATSYGLTDPSADPVSSLRLEELAQGAEDANLFTQLRKAGQGDGAARLLGSLFGAPRQLPRAGDTWAVYPGPKGLAPRLESVRRQAIALLEAAQAG